MTHRFPIRPTRMSRRRFAALSTAMLGAGAHAYRAAPIASAQSMDPFTYIRTMPESETLGQRAGQPVDEIGPTEADGVVWTAMVQVPIKRGQDLHFTCEFDTAWCIMMAYGFDVPLQEQLDAVRIDDRLEPYWEDQGDVVMIQGGDIGEYFCGDLNTNLVARAKGSAMRKAFEAKGLTAEPVRDRAAIEAALDRGHPVFFKSTVDFLDWKPAIWNTPDGDQYKVVFSNDHALCVMAYNESDVVIRDPLGPTTTNDRRPYQYRVAWERFLQVFAAQENDGLAIGPPADGDAGVTPVAAETPTPAISQAKQDPSPTPPASIPSAGAVMQVGSDPLNLRSSASTGGDIVVELKPGARVTVTGEPVEADGYTWYPVKVIDTGMTGFVAADYLQPTDD